MMKQLTQSFKNGDLNIDDVPAPRAGSGKLVVQTAASLVSVGTEKSLLDFAQKNLISKALARPDLLRQVLAKAQAEGILEAWNQAMGRLDTPLLAGYSSAGVVLDVGAGVTGFAVGDRVACTGSGYAGHTEIAVVPANLCVKIPDGVAFDAASFAALGGIALEAVRMAQVSFGETVGVIGLGLLGQLAVQLLNAAGCRVAGIDIDPAKAELAARLGAEAVASDYAGFAAAVHQLSDGQGADAVIILAATHSNEPLDQAAEVCRERGRIVAGGLVGLEIPRKPFYDKELDFVVSRAWGPGLYDPDFAERGLKYPLAYARWTAQRNLSAFLTQVAKGAVRLETLISHRFEFEQAISAYEMILGGAEPYLGVVLTYPGEPDSARTVTLKPAVAATKTSGAIGVGMIGAGLFVNGTMLPAMKGIKGLDYRTIATSSGLSSRSMGQKFGFGRATTVTGEVFSDPEVDLVFIFTRHGSHAHLTAEALQAGKHVFVEKPLTLTLDELRAVKAAYQAAPANPIVMVGFNRRFSPFTQWLKKKMGVMPEPVSVNCLVNAGSVPADSWIHDPQQGGGRIMGEVCHFVDLIQYLSDSVPVRVYAETMGAGAHQPSDNLTVTLKMANGSLGSITYVAGGDKRHPRERVEVVGGGAVGVIHNFTKASLTRGGRIQSKRNWLSVDRGHQGEIVALVNAIQSGGPAPVAFEEYLYTTLATLAMEESLKTGRPVDVDLNVLGIR